MSSIFLPNTMPNQDSAILVTGGTGLVGSEILMHLVSLGYKNLSSLHRQSSLIPSDPWSLSVRWIECDILDVVDVFECLKEQEIVIHAAAEVSFNLSKRDIVILASRQGTANIVNASLVNGISKLVHVSSVAAIGRQKSVEDIDETKMFSHSAFDTSYGLAKFLAEQEVWRGYAEGLNVAIINPSTIIGHGDKMKSSMQLFERIRFNKMPYYPLGSTGWVDIVDVAKATINCLSSNINGQRYIISAENIGYKDVFDLIASSIGQKYNGKPLTPFLSSFLIRIEWFIQFFTKNNPFINKETIKSTSAKSHYINTKSVRDLSIEYKDIRMSIKKAAETYVLGQI